MKPIYFIFPLVFFSSILSQTADDCFPKCRAGYLCHNGKCISKCNPKCPPNTICTDDGECIPINSPVNESTPDSKRSMYADIIPDASVKTILIYNEFRNCLPFKLSTEDADKANDIVLEELEDVFKSIIIVFQSNLGKTWKYEGFIITANVDKYNQEKTDKGQYRGHLTMTFKVFDSRDPRSPIISVTATENDGTDTWGETRVFMRTLENVTEDAVEMILETAKKRNIPKSYFE